VREREGGREEIMEQQKFRERAPMVVH